MYFVNFNWCMIKVHDNFKEEGLLQDILDKLKQEGVCIDRPLLVRIKKDAEKTLNKIKKILSNVEDSFDPDSYQDTRDLLFSRLNLPPVIKTAKGDFSTDNRTLALLLEGGAPLVGYIIKYRETKKLLEQCRNIEKSLDKNNRSHPTYTLNCVTGRAYSNNPSIQNIPKKLRKAIMPAKGKIFISSDYSQIDIRILAHFSKDPLLLKKFNQQKDIYTEIAKDLNVKRDIAKRICLSLVYGEGKWGLSQDLSISQTKAESYMDTFFKRYSKVEKFIEDVNCQAREKGYVLSLAGRKIPVEMGEDIRKKAVARKIQASTADVFLKGALINLFKIFDGTKTRVVFHIHDEIVLETPIEFAKSTEKLVREMMESSWKLEVPLKVKTKISSRWE